jgi:hypothetical protein
VPPAGRIDRNVPAQDFISRWAEEARAGGRQVAAVLGYCAGAAYAAAIAEEVSRWQEPAPTVILFDPQAGTEALTDEMYRQMYLMIDKLGSVLSAEQAEDARKKTAELAGTEVGDLFDLAGALTDLFQQTGSAAFGRLGLSEAGRAETVALFQGYMYWLAVTTHIDPSRTWKISSAILSAEFAAEQDTTGIYGRTIIVDASHADVLRSESAAEKVLEQMKAGETRA